MSVKRRKAAERVRSPRLGPAALGPRAARWHSGLASRPTASGAASYPRRRATLLDRLVPLAGICAAGRICARAVDGLIERNDFILREPLHDLGVGIVGHADDDRPSLELFFVLDEDEPFAASVKTAASGTASDVVRRGNRDAKDGRHAGPHARVDVFDGDAGGEALDAILDHGLRRDAFDDAAHFHAGHGLGLDLHFAPLLEADDIGLVDVGVDHHVVEIGDGHDLGAAVEPAGAGNSLAEGNRAGQHRAIERRHRCASCGADHRRAGGACSARSRALVARS